MRYVIDLGTWSWRCAFAIMKGHETRWTETDKLCESGAILCSDSHASIRKQAYPWYKANRKNLPQVTMDIQKIAHEWDKQARARYSSCMRHEKGLEADDIVAMHYQPVDLVLSHDKDLLQLKDAWLINTKMERWDITRQKCKTLKLTQGERWITYQLLHGDVADNIARTLFSRDRYTAPWVFEQSSPLRAALMLLPEKLARQSLDCLLIPTPLATGADSVEEALRRYPA